MARQPEARLSHVGPAGRAARRRDPRPHVEPDDLPEGDRRLDRLRRAVPHVDRRQRTGRRRLLDARDRRHRRGVRRARSGVRIERRRRRLRQRRGGTRPRRRLGRHGSGGARPSRAHRSAQPDGQDSRHRRRCRPDPADAQRGPEHQHHTDLQPRPPSGGDGRLPRRARGLRRHRRGRSDERGQRRQLLRLPCRHRGRPAVGGHRFRGGARPAGQGGHRPGEARLPPVPPHVLRSAMGGPRRSGAHASSDHCGRARRRRTRRTRTRCTSTS